MSIITACRNKKGFTLVEVMVAMCVLLIGMLALLNTAAVVIDHNLLNVLRDEATGVAGETMTTLKNTPFKNLTVGPSVLPLVNRTFRGFTVAYSVSTVVVQPDPTNPNTLTLQV